MRLDHLLSKEEQVKNGFHCLVIKERQKRQRHKKQKTKDAADFTVSKTEYSGGDARRGHTRSHPEHDG